MDGRGRLRRRLGRMRDRMLYRFSRSRHPIAEPYAAARANGAPAPAPAHLREPPVEELLERISELEATYHLNIKLWGYPQLRKPRYWDRRKIWVTIDEMGRAEEALSHYMREAEASFRSLSGRFPPRPQSLFHEAALQRRSWHPKSKEKLSALALLGPSGSSSGSSSFPVDPSALPRESASKFLTSYYLSLSEIRDNLKRWRADLKAMADQV